MAERRRNPPRQSLGSKRQRSASQAPKHAQQPTVRGKRQFVKARSRAKPPVWRAPQPGRAKRRLKGDDADAELAALFKRNVRLRAAPSDSENDYDSDTSYITDSEDEESEYEDEALERSHDVSECLGFFLSRAPHVAAQLVDRNHRMNAIFMKAYLNKMLRKLNIKDHNGTPRKACNDMLANCHDLRMLFIHFPAAFAN